VPSGHPGRWQLVFKARARLPLERLRSLSTEDKGLVVDLSAEFEAVGWRSIRRIPWAEHQQPPDPIPDEGADPPAEFYATRLGNLSIRLSQQAGAETPPGGAGS
jgi:hypothetical protein